MANSASDLVKDIGGLVTLPDVYLRINQLEEDPKSSTDDITKVVSRAPSFTVRLLRVANSALYGHASSIDTVSKAVTMIGTLQIRSLALSMSVANSFAGLPNELVSMGNFWRHSLLCALVARHLAKQARRLAMPRRHAGSPPRPRRGRSRTSNSRSHTPHRYTGQSCRR